MRIHLALTATAALALAAPAGAATYPPPSNPGQVPSPRAGGAATLRVCPQRSCAHRTIQSAVNAARAGDRIAVAAGIYRGGVKINGPAKDRLTLVGDARRPLRVVIDARGGQNSVSINNSDGVTVNGFAVRNYKANGVLAANVDGYLLTNLVAQGTGVYGLFAFNSKGGTMSNSEAYNHNDAGFYVGQTPPQTRPKRTLITNVKAHTNVLGFSGTNMRYTTITRSQWFNNAVGIVPNALSSEKFPPPSDNVITRNQVFWNNFNYFAGAPFKVKPPAADAFPYPPGSGIILFGSQRTVVEDNDVYGNWLVGAAMIQQIILAGNSNPGLREAATLRRNTFRNNRFGLGGADLNGRDMGYDGTGTENCFSGNVTLSPNLPENNATFAPCPGPAANTFDPKVHETVLAIAGDTTHEAYWLRHPHKPKAGITPLEHWSR
ncbi:MAG: hypothetical protein QOJ97_2978 [Solirubrobacteraceae bacterium]|jgi:hypothetical protein|nr:hypothetical protein [Solirubrobacteraceae bacterium]